MKKGMHKTRGHENLHLGCHFEQRNNYQYTLEGER